MIDSIHPSNCYKFKKYEIQNDAIRPVPAAKLLTFVPSDYFPPVKARDRRLSTVWGDFLERVRQIQVGSVNRYTPSPKGAQLILDWSNQWGLLGILPCQAQMIVLPAVYEPARKHFPTIQKDDPCVVQRKYARIAGHWLAHTLAVNTNDATSATSVSALAKVGRLVPPENLPSGVEQARVVSWEWEQFLLSEHRWHDSPLPQFFLHRPANGQYPLPLTGEFWQNYQEPLGYWMRTAGLFARAVENVSLAAEARFLKKACPVPGDSLNVSIWILNSLAALEGQFYEFGAYVVEKTRTTGGILSVMAETFLIDVMAGRRAVRCGKCETIFVSKDRRARYCSVRCRNAAQTGRYRHKRRDAAEPLRKPLDPRQRRR